MKLIMMVNNTMLVKIMMKLTEVMMVTLFVQLSLHMAENSLPCTFLQFYLLLSHSQQGFWVPERGPTGPQKGDLPDESINIRLSVDPFRPMHVVYFPKAIICIFKPNQKLDGGG